MTDTLAHEEQCWSCDHTYLRPDTSTECPNCHAHPNDDPETE